MWPPVTLPRSSNGKEKLLAVEYCLDGRPHLPVFDPESAEIYCHQCGIELPRPLMNLVRDIGDEVETKFPNSPNVMGSGLGSDLNAEAFKLAGYGLQQQRKAIAKMQLAGGIQEANQIQTQLRIVSTRNMIAPAMKSYLRKSIQQERRRTGQVVDDEAKKIITRILEKRRINLNSQEGIALGKEILGEVRLKIGEAFEKIFLQPPSVAHKIIDEAGENDLVLECVIRGMDIVIERRFRGG